MSPSTSALLVEKDDLMSLDWINGLQTWHQDAQDWGQAVNNLEAKAASAPDSNVPELPLQTATPWKESDLRTRWDQRESDFSEDEKKAAWSEMAGVVKVYSDETVKRWNSEIDTLLVYAGLFSAILTAFNVQSYPLLTPSPPDPVVQTLQYMSTQMTSFSIHGSFINATRPATPSTSSFASSSTSPPRWAIWLNALWFSSLIFSLSAASIGIMVKQWLNEYSSGLSGSSRQTARLRQHRLNGLIKWRVAAIVAILPVLLQVALALFFAGLLILLWQLNSIVAIVASALIGTLALFALGTFVVPSFKDDCPYLSFPSLALFNAVARPIRVALVHARCQISDALAQMKDDLPELLVPLSERVSAFLRVSIGQNALTWRARELSLVTESSKVLDSDIIVTAYTTTMNLGHLEKATACFVGLSPQDIIHYFENIDRANARHRGGEDGSGVNEWHWTDQVPTDVSSDVILALLLEADDDRALTWALQLESLKRQLGWGVYWDSNPKSLKHSYTPSLDPVRLNYQLANLAHALAGLEAYPRWWSERGFDTLVLNEVLYKMRFMAAHAVPLNDDVRRSLVFAMERIFREQLLLSTTDSQSLDNGSDNSRDALRIMLLCVPLPVCMLPAPTTTQTAGVAGASSDESRDSLVRTLLAFAAFLRGPKWKDRREVRYWIDDVFDILRTHTHTPSDSHSPTTVARDLPLELMEVLPAYVDEYETALRTKYFNPDNREWIASLRT